MELLLAGDRRRQALEKIRRDRDATLAEIESTADGRLSLEETVQRLLARLRDDVARAEARVLSFASPSTAPESPQLDAGFLLWVDPQAFEKALRARLKPLLPSSGLAIAERPKRIAALRQRVGELEEAEEREISRLEAQGLVVDRRADADLQILLQVWDSLEPSPV